MDKVTAREESSSSGTIFTVTESVLKKWRFEVSMRKEEAAEDERYMDEYMDEIKKPPAEASDDIMEPQAEASDEIMVPHTEVHGTFGDKDSLEKISASHLRHGVVSISLFNDKMMVYACSGVAVRHWHDNIRAHHRIFVTSARLAHKFNDNRTRDDKLRIEVRTPDNATLHGFLGLYDENIGIAMVTSFSLQCVYTLDTCNPFDLPRGTRNDKLFAFGCATNGTLMGEKCYHPIFKDKGLVSVNCNITETGLGGPVIYFGRGESGHIAGLITGYREGKTTFVPTKMLREWLQRLLLITSKTSHFRGYSLPEGVKTVIPSGCVVRSKILQSLGYPLPPPLVFELNGRLAGRFEEPFGQFHYWDGYPWDFAYCYGEGKPIWEQLGTHVTELTSQSVVSVASFHGKIRCFACTGLLIIKTGYTFVLTSASLVRTGDAECEIDENLRIEVFLPPDHCAEGILEMYHQSYNIAIVSLKHDLATDICPQDIFDFKESRKNKRVVAIGRAAKVAHGLLMASVGEVKGKYKAVTKHKNKNLTGPHQGLDLGCEDLFLSTCQIKKVGIGGPLIGLNGSFIGMNFYDESGTTPFLPREVILRVLNEGFNVLESGLASRPLNMDNFLDPFMGDQIPRERKRNQWPVSKPYWCLHGQ